MDIDPYRAPESRAVAAPRIRNYSGYRVTILLQMIYAAVLPFVWAYRLAAQYDLTFATTILAYRPELIAVVPSAAVLAGTALYRHWAVPALVAMAVIGAILKFSLGGAPTDAWIINGVLFLCLALRLHFILKSTQHL